MWKVFVTLLRMAERRKTNPQENLSELPAVITSRDNRWLKRYRSALAGEHSGDDFVGVEGVRMVEAALGSGLPVESLLVSKSGERHLSRLAPLLASGLQILRTTDRLFSGVADTQKPQGVAEDVVEGLALVVVLVGVQDPGNVGTILRAAEAFGVTGAATCAGTANPLSPKALRASAGSALRLPILRSASSATLLAQLRVSKVKLYAAVPDCNSHNGGRSDATPTVKRPWEADWKSRVALLIGNEGAGLPEEIVRSCDARVTIPQRKSKGPMGVESLNAAMAGTVLLYEAMRQRDATL